jgi:hypothetical protein
MSASSNSTAGREKPGVPRVTLTIAESASALGVSEASFRRHNLPNLRVVAAGPRLTLIRVSELDRWAEKREVISGLR